MLVSAKKFDLRMYVILISANPFILLFKEGYAKLTINKYDLKSEDMSIHLTNFVA